MVHTFFNSQSWRPLTLQDVKANAPTAMHIWIENWSCECNFWRLEWESIENLMVKLNTPSWYGEFGGPFIAACQFKRSSPTGPTCLKL